jgi:hypothetical protein
MVRSFFGMLRVAPGVSGTDDAAADDGEAVRVWLVERTYSDDEQNMIILTYATPDGEQYFRKERALTSYTDVRDTTAAVDAEPDNLGAVEDPDVRERYAGEATRMAEAHDPDHVI